MRRMRRTVQQQGPLQVSHACAPGVHRRAGVPRVWVEHMHRSSRQSTQIRPTQIISHFIIRLEMSVSVILPTDNSFDDSIKRNPEFDGTIEHTLHVGGTDCFVVRNPATGHAMLVHPDMCTVIESAKRRIMAPRTPLVGCEGRYRIREEIGRDDQGRKVGGTWTKAKVLRQIGKDHVLLRLTEYDEQCWWSGYEVVRIDSARLKLIY